MAELKRRRVFRVVAVYALVAWAMLQVVVTVAPLLGLPAWTARLVLLLLGAGFPIAVALAWMFDITPEGVKRATAEAGALSAANRTLSFLGAGLLILLIAAAGYARFYLRGNAAITSTPGSMADSPSAGADRSIAVLPFSDLSEKRDQGYFSDGITEDLLTHLSRVPGLRVISRTSVMQYKNTTKPLKQIAQELGVSHVLEGSVRRAEGQVRVSAQLIDARTDGHLWAEAYDRELKDIFRIQSEIAQNIANALRATLSPDQRNRIAEGGTSNVSAYDFFLKGREYLNRPGSSDVRKYPPAVAAFRHALSQDSMYARAYVGLSIAFRDNPALPRRVRRDSALAFARKAIQLDSQLANAHVALGGAYVFPYEHFTFTGDRRKAEEQYLYALRLNPNHADAMRYLSLLVRSRGEPLEALHWAEKARGLDPSAHEAYSGVGDIYMALGDTARAAQQFRRAAEIAPDFPWPRGQLARIYLMRGDRARADSQMVLLRALAPGHRGTLLRSGEHELRKGDYAAAHDYFVRADALAPEDASLATLAFLAQKLGDRARAAQLIAQADAKARNAEAEGFTDPWLRIAIQALRGETADALRRLREEYNRGWRARWPDRSHPEIVAVKLLESDPRFQALLRVQRAELAALQKQLPPPVR